MLEAKVESDKKRFEVPVASILDTIEDRETIKKDSRIRHKIYGEGTVMQVMDGAYVILFDEVGIKGIKSDSNKIEKI